MILRHTKLEDQCVPRWCWGSEEEGEGVKRACQAGLTFGGEAARTLSNLDKAGPHAPVPVACVWSAS